MDHGDVQGGETIAWALAPYWVARYLTWEAERWLAEILEASDDDPSPRPVSPWQSAHRIVS